MAPVESAGPPSVGTAVAKRVRHHDPADKRVFDRLTRLVSALLDAPVSLLQIAEDDKLLFASVVGPDDPWGAITEFPLEAAFCQFAIGSRAPFVIEDARLDPLVCDLPPAVAMDVVAYLGVPLLTATDEPIGILCAIDFEPRAWTEQQVRVVQDLAATVMAYLEARREPPKLGAGLNIAAVSQRTGIGADTLRKWERRYGVLRPGRTTGGQRRYDETDVARVVWLRDRLAEGFRIGEAAALLDAGAPRPTASTTDLRDAIVKAAGAANTLELVGLVEQAFVLHDICTAVEEVVAPALRAVGDSWQTDPAAIGGEHLLSEIALARLRTLLADRRPAVNGTVVLACGPGERHELGLLALAVTLQADGWLAVYLGADTPLHVAIATAVRTSANVLCVSASDAAALEDLEAGLAKEEIPDGLVVVTGGAALGGEEAPGLAATVARLREAAVTRRG